MKDEIGNENNTPKYIMPSRFSELLEQADFELIVQLAFDYAEANNKQFVFKEDHLEEVAADGELQNKMGLDTLIRVVIREDISEWQRIVFDHFGKFNNVKQSIEIEFEDYDRIKDKLIIRIYPESVLKNVGKSYEDMFVYRVDLEETVSVICVDLPDKFATVSRVYLEEWDVTAEELFEAAQQNILQYKHLISSHIGEVEGIKIGCFLDRDFAASFILDLQQNAPDYVGIYGALVSMPTKGTVFVHPIGANTIREAISIIAPQCRTIYTKEEGPISLEFYWYYQGKYYMFPYTIEEGKKSLRMPITLVQLLSAGLN